MTLRRIVQRGWCIWSHTSGVRRSADEGTIFPNVTWLSWLIPLPCLAWIQSHGFRSDRPCWLHPRSLLLGMVQRSAWGQPIRTMISRKNPSSFNQSRCVRQTKINQLWQLCKAVSFTFCWNNTYWQTVHSGMLSKVTLFCFFPTFFFLDEWCPGQNLGAEGERERGRERERVSYWYWYVWKENMSHNGALKNQESSQNRKPISFIKKTTLGKIMMTQSGSVNFLNIHRITHTHWHTQI